MKAAVFQKVIRPWKARVFRDEATASALPAPLSGLAWIQLIPQRVCGFQCQFSPRVNWFILP